MLVLGLVVGSAAALRDRPRRRIAGFAAGTVVAALVLSGRNLWPSVSGWFTPSFSTKPVDVAGVPLATITLVVGGVVVVAVLARAGWLRAGGATAGSRCPAGCPPRRRCSAVLLVAVLVLQVGSLARVAVAHPDSYTPAADVARHAARAAVRAAAAAVGRAAPRAPGCCWPDPGRSTEPVAAVRPVDIGGRPLPGIAVAGRQHTGWFALDPAQRARRLPVVVTVSGVLRVADQLFVEFGDDAGQVVHAAPDRRARPGRGGRRLPGARRPAAGPAERDRGPARRRGPAGRPDAARPRCPCPGCPGSPRWSTCCRRAARPCWTGRSRSSSPACARPRCRWAPRRCRRGGWPRRASARTPGITYRPSFGGPFAGPRLLVTEQRMPTYLAGDPVREAAQLRRWVPVEPLRQPAPDRRRAGDRRLDTRRDMPGCPSSTR